MLAILIELRTPVEKGLTYLSAGSNIFRQQRLAVFASVAVVCGWYQGV